MTKFLFELGFLIVVQDKDEKEGGTTIGEFVPGDRQKPLKCSSSVYSGITHANPEAKNEVRNNHLRYSKLKFENLTSIYINLRSL